MKHPFDGIEENDEKRPEGGVTRRAFAKPLLGAAGLLGGLFAARKAFAGLKWGTFRKLRRPTRVYTKMVGEYGRRPRLSGPRAATFNMREHGRGGMITKALNESGRFPTRNQKESGSQIRCIKAPCPGRVGPATTKAMFESGRTKAMFESGKPPTRARFESGRPATKAMFESGRPITKAMHESGRPITKAMHESGRPITKAMFESGRPITKAMFESGKPPTRARFESGRPATKAMFESGKPTTRARFESGGARTKALREAGGGTRTKMLRESGTSTRPSTTGRRYTKAMSESARYRNRKIRTK